MAEESNNDLNPIIINTNGNVNNRVVESSSADFGLLGAGKKPSLSGADDTRSLDGILSNGSGSLTRRMHLNRPPLVPYYHSDHLVLIQNSAEDHLGPLPPKWEKAYTENGEAYFIDHNSGTSHWLDPRLSKFQKKKLEECDENELPFGWEKISDPHYGQYFIDHVNRKTQYENPVLQAKRLAERRAKEEMEKAFKFTKNPSELCGERISTTLLKSARGLGFTIVGGDDNVEEFLQIKSIVPNGPAWLDGKLKTGDILVYVNDICVLGFTHHEMVNIFQSILAGELVTLDICRGYPLPFDPNDPNTEVVTTIAVDGITSDAEKSRIFMDLNLDGNYNFLDLSDQAAGGVPQQKNPLAKIQGGSLKNDSLLTTITSAANNNNNSSFEIPEILSLTITKGPMGFGFTIADTNGYGQKVKKILDRQCCTNLQEGDLLLSINSISVKMMSHNEVVQVLKECPKNEETTLRVQRGALPSNTNRFTAKLRKVGDTSKYGSKKEQMHANLFRSKTPTADFYSQGQREPQPSRPKTPLVDTRNRAACKTPLNELNPEAIELEAAGEIVDMPTSKSMDLHDVANGGVADTKSNHSFADHDSINNDSTTYVDANYPKMVGNLSDRLNDVNLSDARSDSLYVEPAQHLKPIKSSLFGQLDPKPQHFANQPPVNGYYQQKYDPMMPPHFAAPPIPTYHHESCFCYECQEYNRRLHDYNTFVQQHQQQQHQQQQQQQQSPHSPTATNQQYSLPPQMSDNIGKRIHDYINDRRRILGNTPTSNVSSYNTNEAMMDGFNYNNNNMVPGNWNWGGQSGGGQPSPRNQDEYQLTEVTLERQALGFGFRIVGGTEEGSQVTVGHIVPGGAADQDARITTGDEILNINGVNVENASHHRVVQLMGQAGLCGQVTMILRRKVPRSQSSALKYPYDVIVNRNENEGFGFVVISSSTAHPNGMAIAVSFKIGKLIPGSPAERCGELKIGDRIIAVNNVDIGGNMSHGDVVGLIKESGLQVRLTIGNPAQLHMQQPTRPPPMMVNTAGAMATNNGRNNGMRMPIIS